MMCIHAGIGAVPFFYCMVQHSRREITACMAPAVAGCRSILIERSHPRFESGINVTGVLTVSTVAWAGTNVGTIGAATP